MSKEQRYTYYIDEFDEFDWAIIDNTTDESYEYLEEITKILNEQDQKIKELEHRLSNCIEPKFKIGQEVWFVSLTDNVCNFVIEDLQFTLCGDGKSAMCYYDKNNVEHFEFNLFATEEEAKAKLEKIKNANN